MLDRKTKFVDPALGKPISPVGPQDAEVVIVGEAPEINEEARGAPFVGKSGELLWALLAHAGFERDRIYVTNVFLQRPPGNDVSYFFCERANAGIGAKLLPVQAGKYIAPRYIGRISELLLEVQRLRPKVVVALGNTALWALAQVTGIGTHRGAIRRLRLTHSGAPEHECLLVPTFHPAAILRQYHLRGVLEADLEKAYRAATGTLKREAGTLPTIHYEPTRSDLRDWGEAILAAPRLGVDVETAGGMISMIGFATSKDLAFVVPIFDPADWSNYWAKPDDEAHALAHIRQWLQGPARKVFQNGLYDIQYIWRTWKFPPANCTDDTMLLHHAQQPEVQKGLGFLSSIYLDNPAWKSWRQNRTKQKEAQGKEE